MQPSLRIALVACAGLLPAPAQDHLVKFHVAAVDSHGQPVTDLNVDDFQVQEQGKNLKIALFRTDTPKSSAAAPAPTPHQFSNHTDRTAVPTTVILLDLVHPIDLRLGRSQILKIFTSLRPEDRIYFYLMTVRGLFPVRPIPATAISTADPTLTVEQIDKALESGKKINLDGQGADVYTITYQTLDLMASQLARLPGRKNMVFLSEGVSIAGSSGSPNLAQDYTVHVRRLVAALQAGNIGFYPVGDARRSVATQQLGTVNEISDKTGGRSHMDMDLLTSLKNAGDDSRSGYLLGFNSGNSQEGYRKVKVTCSRRGVRLITTDGYYAEAAAKASDARYVMENALTSAFDNDDIGIVSDMSASKAAAKAIHIAVRISGPDVQIARKESGFAGDVAVSLASIDSAGAARVLKEHGFAFQMNAAQYENAMQKGVTVNFDESVPDGVKALRIVVLDRSNNTFGSLTLPVSAADLSQ